VDAKSSRRFREVSHTITPFNHDIMISQFDAAVSGVGVYSIPQAARYARMPAPTLRNWFFGGKTRQPIRPPGIEGDEKSITFLDLVEAIAVRSLRVDHGVRLEDIRSAIQFASKEYSIEHIFAREDHRIYVSGSRKKLYIVLKDEPDPISLSPKDAGQKDFRELFQGYMPDLVFGDKKLAELYIAYRDGNQKVIMHPGRHFGEPIVEENGYPVDVLWQAVITEGGFERAASLYEVTPDSVMAAYRYCHAELNLTA
jgi:uncharacterized protein (DUF433 family)